MIPRDHGIQEKMGNLVAAHLAAANLLGRAQIAETVQRKTGKQIKLATSSRFRKLFDDSADDGTTDGGSGDTYGNLALPYAFSTKLPATNAVDYLRNLTPVTKNTFDGLSAQYKKDAFTVAGTTDLRLIAKVRDQLADVMQKGGTEADFEAAVKQMETEAGVEEINAFALIGMIGVRNVDAARDRAGGDVAAHLCMRRHQSPAGFGDADGTALRADCIGADRAVGHRRAAGADASRHQAADGDVGGVGLREQRGREESCNQGGSKEGWEAGQRTHVARLLHAREDRRMRG